MELEAALYGRASMEPADGLVPGPARCTVLAGRGGPKRVLLATGLQDRAGVWTVAARATGMASPCIGLCVLMTGKQVVLFDVQNPRFSVIEEGEEPRRMLLDCILNYLDTGRKVAFEPAFRNARFKTKAWAAFKEQATTLEAHGIGDKQLAVKIILQVLIYIRLHAMGTINGNDWNNLPREMEALRNGGTTLVGTRQDYFACHDHGLTFILAREDVGAIVKAGLESTIASIVHAFQSLEDTDLLLDEYAIAHLMEVALPWIQKKKSGSYYTPRTWAMLASHVAVRKWTANNAGGRDLFSNMKVLDPAMGAGEFLDSMADTLIERAELSGEPHPGDGNLERMALKRDVLFEHVLHGIDINQLAVDITRARLHLNTVKHASFAREPFLHGNRATNASPTLSLADFLTGDFERSKFDIIIGNPPYLMEVRSNKDIFARYSHHPATRKYYGQKIDLFYLFMFKGVEAAKDRGIVALFVQEYWLDRFHARNLREFMFMRTTMETIILFKNHVVFPSAPGHHTMFFTACTRTPGPDDEATIMEVLAKGGEDAGLLRALLDAGGKQVRSSTMRLHELYDGGIVYTGGQPDKDLMDRLRAYPHEFLEPGEVQIGINIPNPSYKEHGEEHGIFVLSNHEIAKLEPNEQEKALLRPFHVANEIYRWGYKDASHSAIIYADNVVKRAISDDPGSFPHIKHHLDGVAGRNTSDHKPYGLHRPRHPGWFESTSKIIGVRKTAVPRFSVVPIPYYMDQGAIFIKIQPGSRLDPHYLCAYLNSSTSARVLKALKSQGNQLQVDKSVLLKIPVPVLPATVTLLVTEMAKWAHVRWILSHEGRGTGDKDDVIKMVEDVIDKCFEISLAGRDTEAKLDQQLEDLLNTVPSAPAIQVMRDNAVDTFYDANVIDTRAIGDMVRALDERLRESISAIMLRLQ